MHGNRAQAIRHPPPPNPAVRATSPPGVALPNPELDDAADQVRRQRLTQRELHGTLALLEGRQLRLERLDRGRDRVEPHVIRMAGEVDEVLAIKVERGHGVADALRGPRCGGADD